MNMRKNALASLRKNLRTVGDEVPVKKVSVMADSEEGLMEGLEKAEDIMESKLGGEMESESEDMEMEGESEEKDYSDEALAMMSREELIDCIKKMRDEESEY
jgi:hypothetical protein